ncbi:unnamed protein product [Linum trigynum]|uniref:Uncharacterized protein n=1 Tax=Linum trigynum TaxID=586398 RepID=A0AAV2EQY7_9ROSI
MTFVGLPISQTAATSVTTTEQHLSPMPTPTSDHIALPAPAPPTTTVAALKTKTRSVEVERSYAEENESSLKLPHVNFGDPGTPRGDLLVKNGRVN